MKSVARSLAGTLRGLTRGQSTYEGAPADAAVAPQQAPHLLHELQIHQAELEAQNEELRATRARLEATAARYAELYDFAPVGYFTLDTDGIISSVNLLGAELVGRERALLYKTPFAPLVSAVHQQIFRRFLNDAFAAAPGVACELRMRGPDESARVLRLEAARVEEGAACQIVAVDVTERVRREQELTRERERAATAERMAGAGVWDCDLRSRAIDGSPEFFRLFGMDPASVPQPFSGWRSRLHPQDAARVDREFVRAITTGQPFVSEFRIVLPDGAVRWVAAHGDTTYDAGHKPQRMTGICLDTTARKQAEIDRERYRRFFDSASELMSITDRHGRRVQVNGAFCRTLGYSREELLAACPAANVHPDDLSLQVAELSKLGPARQSVDYTIRYVCRNADCRWISWHAVFDPQDNSIYSVGRDITDGRAAEEALCVAKEAAETANRAKTAFLAAASHDLRQPLTALELYVDTLKHQAPQSDQSILRNMEGCIESLTGLLVDLLDLSKLEAGVVVPEITAFPLRAVFDAVSSIHAPSADVKGLRFRCRPSAKNARTDTVLFERLLGNLVSNAIRYTECGGVLMAYRRRQGKDWIEVWDTGIGIPEQKISEIFEEFRQLGDAARNRGSGLGLAIVAKTAALLELEIRVRSTPGRGSCFAIELPSADEALALPPKAVPVPLRPLRIALVEDHKQLRMALALTLRADGHEVLEMGDSSELEAKLVAFNPDVLLSDYRLPHNETGFNVITAARVALGREVPAMVLTGDTDPDVVRFMAEQGTLVLHKPIVPEVLRAHIQELAERSLQEPQPAR